MNDNSWLQVQINFFSPEFYLKKMYTAIPPHKLNRKTNKVLVVESLPRNSGIPCLVPNSFLKRTPLAEVTTQISISYLTVSPW